MATANRAAQTSAWARDLLSAYRTPAGSSSAFHAMATDMAARTAKAAAEVRLHCLAQNQIDTLGAIHMQADAATTPAAAVKHMQQYVYAHAQLQHQLQQRQHGYSVTGVSGMADLTTAKKDAVNAAKPLRATFAANINSRPIPVGLRKPTTPLALQRSTPATTSATVAASHVSAARAPTPMLHAEPAAAVAKEKPLPPGWVFISDGSSGNRFYYHEGTQEATWNRPTAASTDTLTTVLHAGTGARANTRAEAGTALKYSTELNAGGAVSTTSAPRAAAPRAAAAASAVVVASSTSAAAAAAADRVIFTIGKHGGYTIATGTIVNVRFRGGLCQGTVMERVPSYNVVLDNGTFGECLTEEEHMLTRIDSADHREPQQQLHPNYGVWQGLPGSRGGSSVSSGGRSGGSSGNAAVAVDSFGGRASHGLVGAGSGNAADDDEDDDDNTDEYGSTALSEPTSRKRKRKRKQSQPQQWNQMPRVRNDDARTTPPRPVHLGNGARVCVKWTSGELHAGTVVAQVFGYKVRVVVGALPSMFAVELFQSESR